MTYYSWGRIAECNPAQVFYPTNRDELLPNTTHKILSIGNLRSYGDSCFNDDGFIISNNYLNHFIDFDRINGYLTAEAGVSFLQI